jgi:uncharacterized protein YbbC (DUF1343 family)
MIDNASFTNLRLATAIILTAITTLIGSETTEAQGLPQVAPEAVGIRGERLALVAEIIEDAILEKKLPGCVVCVGRHGKIAWLEAFGNKRCQPQPEAMTTDTVFDMASITKPVATATAIMQLIEQGKLRLEEKIAGFIPDFGKHGKEAITIEHLLTHRSGLIPDNPLSDYDDGPEEAWARICDLSLVAPVGSAFKYSDVNFIVLGKVVEHLSGLKLDRYVRQSIYEPLGMIDTGFLPRAELKHRAAPTEKRNGDWIQGEVHDPRAYALGGVAGHAGLFSTAADLAVYAQMMLGRGTLVDARQRSICTLSPATVALMTSAFQVPGGLRGLGWDKRTTYSSNRGDLLSPAAFGHGGFTGTVLWIDPELDLFFIFLSNRLHPDGQGSVNTLAGKLLNVLVSSLTDYPKPQQAIHQVVLTGIDVLERDRFQQLAGRRVGLITNHTGRNREGISTVRLFQQSPAVKLQVLFSPEHGFRGNVDVPRVSDSTDSETGIKIISLYGEHRRPTAEMLAEIDTLVFDIQDIGTRFYTYVSTMGEAMTAAAEHGCRFVVLDRPNPINGIQVTGPMLEAGAESFVGFHRLPIRHGMTIGELAQMVCDERKLTLALEVIRCEGWQRADYWDATGLTWINPSPNMRSLNQALLYPGLGLLEFTNLSVGRGSDTPFEVFGAPWLNHQQLAQHLRQQQLLGVTFIPIEFTPTASKFAQQTCRGIQIVITNREVFEPVRMGLAIAAALRQHHPEEWQTSNLNRLLGNQQVLKTLLDPALWSDREQAITEEVGDFLSRRARYLLY